ncbi:isochorismatase family protein [Mesorhizobium sp. M0659]|uniref:isochorismatase family protein n=1 Tax=Mesorhizobium sp. M0659 TaxID=2956980 RepID=UPI00333A06D3
MKSPISIKRGTVAAAFIDLQEEHRQDKRYLVEGYGEVLANVQRLQAAARRNFVPLYHWAYIVDAAKAHPFHPLDADGKSAFSDKSDPLTEICPEVAPAAGETMLVKTQASAFGGGPAATELKARGIEWLIVAGDCLSAGSDRSSRAALWPKRTRRHLPIVVTCRYRRPVRPASRLGKPVSENPGTPTRAR